VAVVYSLAHRWTWERDVLTLLGAKDPDRLDTLLGQGSSVSRVDRIRSAAAVLGGEIRGR
jgi:hypothetical protein